MRIGTLPVPRIWHRVVALMRMILEALVDGFVVHGAYLELKRRGVDPGTAAQIILISHFSQRG
jgi:hypothetical protein